jgi:hypothetical protein
MLRTFAIGAAILAGIPAAGLSGPSCAGLPRPCAIAFAVPATGTAVVAAVSLKQSAPLPESGPQGAAAPASNVNPPGGAMHGGAAQDDVEAAFHDESAAAHDEAGRGLVAWLLILAVLAGAGLLAYRHLPALQDGAVPDYLRQLREIPGVAHLRSMLRGRHRQRSLPPLFVPPGLAAATRGQTPSRGTPHAAAQGNGGSSAAPPASRKPAPLFRYPPPPGPQLPVMAGAGTAGPGTTPGRPGAGTAAAAATGAARPVATASAAAATVVRDEPASEEVQLDRVHFHRPPEGTLQLLPGRLDIVGGTDRKDEIRFVRLPGREPVITFGRSDGEPHTHVRLNALTVSRVHAAMLFRNGSWFIENRSTTNPVMVNGLPLPLAGGAPVKLSDGDTMELGEVIFRFRLR